MFDLDANPVELLTSMRADSCMASLWAQHPGLRLARSWSAYESVFTTVLGQLVSVAFGRALTQELMRLQDRESATPKRLSRSRSSRPLSRYSERTFPKFGHRTSGEAPFDRSLGRSRKALSTLPVLSTYGRSGKRYVAFRAWEPGRRNTWLCEVLGMTMPSPLRTTH